MKDTTDDRQPLTPRPRRFIVYIDGYNLYKAIASPDKLKFGWCNYKRLAHRLCERSFGDAASAPDAVVEAKYFTARVRQTDNRDEDTGGHKGEQRRQKLWLDTLKEVTGMQPICGQHLKVREWRGAALEEFRREKMTDVNIALEMVEDARTTALSGMVLISGDLDLCPAVNKVVLIGVPVVVFNPQDHPHYAMPLATHAAGLFEMRYLGTDVLDECPLGHEEKWVEYLQLKLESVPPGHKDFPGYAALLKQEQQMQRRNRPRVLPAAASARSPAARASVRR